MPADLGALEQQGRLDLIAGEGQLEAYAEGSAVRGNVSGLTGWIAARDVKELAAALAALGGAVIPLDRPKGVDPPTLLRPGGTVRRSLEPLVATYATVPYRDVDPTVPAGVAYMLMFGMMFADVGHGALLVLAGVLLRSQRFPRLARYRRIWPFVTGAGAAACVFGILYGEFFGPTGLAPTLWLDPLEQPITLLIAALAVGAVLLAGAYGLGIANRWREGGWPLALSAPSGIAGAALFAGFGVALLAAITASAWIAFIGAAIAAGGIVLCYLGFLASSGGGTAGIVQATVEVFDAVIRVGSNTVSFARLAAFGLTHAALGQIVWQGTTALWARGFVAAIGAVTVVVVGNALAVTLETVVAGVQALRLEYYELFSRVFTAEGRPFRPWRVPVEDAGPADPRPEMRVRDDVHHEDVVGAVASSPGRNP
jgi:V/A-type H+-transporting ATPase subunit I